MVLNANRPGCQHSLANSHLPKFTHSGAEEVIASSRNNSVGDAVSELRVVPCDMPHKLLINIWQRPELWKRYQSRAAAKQFGNGLRYRIQRFDRSEERREGKECVSTCRDR